MELTLGRAPGQERVWLAFRQETFVHTKSDGRLISHDMGPCGSVWIQELGVSCFHSDRPLDKELLGVGLVL